nr:hypothetical protein [Micromonospora sp. DSM 115978]
AQVPAVRMPPRRIAHPVAAPALLLPGSDLTVCLDTTSGDQAAARWWTALAVEATYAALWHQWHHHGGPAPARTAALHHQH